MMQYEIAYDPSINQISSDDMQICWTLNYYNVEKISFDGNIVGKLKGVIGSSGGSNMFSSLSNLGKTTGTGVLAGIGQNIIKNNTINPDTGENSLGLSSDVFKSISKGISGALSGACGDFPGAAIKVLSAIFGGSSSSSMPISIDLKAEIKLEGTGTNGGSFPSNPISFWVPGTNFTPQTIGYVPLYNKTLGVLNFSGKPKIEFYVTDEHREEPDEPFDPDRTRTIVSHTVEYPQKIDYSKYLVINPEVLKNADVTILKQELVSVREYYNQVKKTNETNVILNPTEDYWEDNDCAPYDNKVKFVDRFTLKVKPHNGGAISTIIKSLLLEDVWK